jgi:Flp pilus assembly protein TadG
MITHAKSSQLRSKSWKRSKGAELVEMALILQVLLMLLIGVFWIGRACHIYGTITQAAQEGARVAVAPSCGTCDSGNPDDSAVNAAVERVLNLNNITATVSIQHLHAIDLTTSQDEALLDPVNSNARWTVIKITSPFHLDLPYLNIRPINISTHIQMLEEQ